MAVDWVTHAAKSDFLSFATGSDAVNVLLANKY
jgi:hypothetical protein